MSMAASWATWSCCSYYNCNCCMDRTGRIDYARYERFRIGLIELDLDSLVRFRQRYNFGPKTWKSAPLDGCCPETDVQTPEATCCVAGNTCERCLLVRSSSGSILNLCIRTATTAARETAAAAERSLLRRTISRCGDPSILLSLSPSPPKQSQRFSENYSDTNFEV